jgi:hypothetical protein
MSSLLHLLQSLLPSIESQHERDEAYLAASVDLYDLERRMRSLEDRGRRDDSAIVAGLYNR